MKAVADTLAVARSNLNERVRRPRRRAALLQGRGRGAIAADPPAGRRAADLRLSAHHGAREQELAAEGKPSRQPQACLPDHEGQPTDLSGIPAAGKGACMTARSW